MLAESMPTSARIWRDGDAGAAQQPARSRNLCIGAERRRCTALAQGSDGCRRRRDGGSKARVPAASAPAANPNPVHRRVRMHRHGALGTMLAPAPVFEPARRPATAVAPRPPRPAE